MGLLGFLTAGAAGGVADQHIKNIDAEQSAAAASKLEQIKAMREMNLARFKANKSLELEEYKQGEENRRHTETLTAKKTDPIGTEDLKRVTDAESKLFKDNKLQLGKEYTGKKAAGMKKVVADINALRAAVNLPLLEVQKIPGRENTFLWFDSSDKYKIVQGNIAGVPVSEPKSNVESRSATLSSDTTIPAVMTVKPANDAERDNILQSVSEGGKNKFNATYKDGILKITLAEGAKPPKVDGFSVMINKKTGEVKYFKGKKGYSYKEALGAVKKESVKPKEKPVTGPGSTVPIEKPKKETTKKKSSKEVTPGGGPWTLGTKLSDKDRKALEDLKSKLGVYAGKLKTSVPGLLDNMHSQGILTGPARKLYEQ